MPKIRRIVSHRKLLPFLIFSILILALGVTLRLLPQKQQVPNAEAITPLFGATPHTELYKYPRPINHIQTYQFLAFGGKNDLLLKSSAAIPYLDYFIYDYQNYIYTPDPTLDWPDFDAAPQAIKAINPNIKVGIIINAATLISPWYHTYQALNGSDFLHAPSGALIIQDTHYTHINVSSPTTRNKIGQYWKDQVLAHKFDLLLIDSYGSSETNPVFAGGCLEGDCRNRDWWYPNIKAASQTYLSYLPAGTELVYNGLGPVADNNFYGFMNTKFLEDTTGAFSEHPETILTNQSHFKNYLDAYNLAISQGKKVFFYADPQFACPPPPPNGPGCNTDGANIPIVDNGVLTNLYNDINMERYFLAYYLLFQKNPYTFFNYHPGPAYSTNPDQNGGVFMYKDWNQDFGTAPGGYEPVPGTHDMYYRRYTNGDVVVNNSSEVQNFPLLPGTFRIWDPVNGQQVSGNVPVPPKSGQYYFSKIPDPTPFTLSMPQTVCSGTNSHVKLNWDEPQYGPNPNDNSGYFVYLNGTYTYNNLFNPVLTDPQPRTPGQTLNYKIEAVTSHGRTFSNEQTIRVDTCKPGDIGGSSGNWPDGQVNLQDYVLLFESYGTTPGQSKWNPRADVNGNSRVDILDYVLLFENFGR